MSKTASSRRDRLRISAFEAAVLAVIAFALIAAAMASGDAARPAATSTRTVKVAAGETLWELASTHPIAGLSTAQTVERIAELNGLSTHNVTAGQSLNVPRTQYEGAVAAR